MTAVTLDSIIDDLRAGYNWLMADEPRKSLDFVLSALGGITALFFPSLSGRRAGKGE